MALLLNEIEWGEPLLPAVLDPEWEADMKRRSNPLNVDRRTAPLPWLREACFAFRNCKPVAMPEHLFFVVAMVVAQENSCRYCYGKNRAVLKILGRSEAFIDGVERDLRVAELDEREGALLAFCRNLARSRPRPARAEREPLIQLGYSALAVTEVAAAAARSCFYNRVGTLMACPLELELEQASTGPVEMLKAMGTAMLQRFSAQEEVALQTVPVSAATLAEGAYGSVLATMAGLPWAIDVKAGVDGALASTMLSRTAKALIFAVVARGLACRRTEAEARALLQAEGVDDHEIDAALATLQSRRLAPQESGLLAWARETVNYQTPVIQKQTRQLAAQLGDTAVLEAIGVAGLANYIARMAMLLE